MAQEKTAPRPYTGLTLGFLTFVLSMANVMEVLDLTIANVAIPTITGDLAVSPSQGAWVITSYAVANAITVPLAGWFAARYGQVRVYATMIALFTAASLLCALANSLELLVTFRVLQGAAAGFMIPLSQALLLGNFPPQKRGMALAIWVMTITVAPIVGPLLGGWITDNYHWSWIFLINLPVGIFASAATWLMLRDRDTETRRVPVDWTGIALLVLWVGSLQILLDKGNELDWFNSGFIVALGVLAALGFVLFIAWELTDAHPVVDLNLLRFHNFRSGVVTVAMGYALFFAGIILLPLWLQTQLGYTSLWAGYALAPSGVFAVLFAPLVGRAIGKGFDPRILATVGFLTFALTGYWRASFNTGADFVTVMLPQLLQGFGVAFFFAPLFSINLSGIPIERIAHATALQNFLRMMLGSFAASITIAGWDHRQSIHRTRLIEHVNAYDAPARDVFDRLTGLGMSADQAYAQINRMVDSESYMLATNDVYWVITVLFVAMIALLWTTRPPFGPAPGAR